MAKVSGSAEFIVGTSKLVTQECNDTFLEQMVSRLSLEPSVIVIRWRILEQESG